MKIVDLKGKKITVMGLGLHGGGIGTVRFLHDIGAKLTVTDLKSKDELLPSLEKLNDLKGIRYVLGQHRMEDFSNTDMVVKSPPVPWNNTYIKVALEKKIPVEIDSSLFFKLCKNTIIGVTGTRGKTTTSSLIYAILKTAGKNPIKVGIGQISVLDKLKDLKKDSIVIFELSSWRLSALGRYKLRPKIAVFTNLFQDHLNYYKNIADYLADKKNIYKNQKTSDFCIINGDSEALVKLESEIRSQVIKFSYNKINNGRAVYVTGDSIYINDGTAEKKVIYVSDIKIKGVHNIGNILASIGVAYAMEIKTASIKKALTEFKGLSHRLEFVRELAGIKYYNDTAATSPDGAISGINSFSEPIILICGGSDKNLDMSEFGKVIALKTKNVILLKGKASEKIQAAIKRHISTKSDKGEFVVDSMDMAVELARKLAENGDIVLLSPGAASFGLFANEFDRGDKFKASVSNLK